MGPRDWLPAMSIISLVRATGRSLFNLEEAEGSEVVLFAVRCNLALVTNWPPTAADRALLREVEALGQTVTRRQLKRWRQERLVPPPEQPGAGRGKGRPSLHYPQGTAQVVAKVAQVVGDGYSFHEAALALFLADLPVPEDLVRQALLDALDIAPAVQREPDPDQRIELVSRLVPVVKRLARRHPVMRHLSRRSHGQVLLGPEGQKYRGRPPAGPRQSPVCGDRPAVMRS